MPTWKGKTFAYSIDAKSGTIALIDRDESTAVAGHEREANAHLMAAAPEMESHLAELAQWLRDRADSLSHIDGMDDLLCEMQSEADRIDDLLAQATGND